MKINITYQQEEVRKVRLILRFIEGLVPAVKVRFSDRHAPYFHAYLTVTPPEENGNLRRKNPL